MRMSAAFCRSSRRRAISGLIEDTQAILPRPDHGELPGGQGTPESLPGKKREDPRFLLAPRAWPDASGPPQARALRFEPGAARLCEIRSVWPPPGF